jgi:hypothetical protein
MTQSGDPIATFAYRPRLGLILAVGGFFGLGVVVLGHKAQTTGETEALLAALASGAFVVLALLLMAMRTLRPQQISVFADGIVVPVGRWGSGTVRIANRDVQRIVITTVNGQVFATLHHPGGAASLHRSMFPENQDFDDVLAFLETGLWRGEAPSLEPVASLDDSLRDATLLDAPGPGPGPAPATGARTQNRPAPVIPAPVIPATVVAAQAGAARPWMGLGLKVGALACFCGGPLRATDALRPILGKDPAFAVAFAPILLLLFGSFAVLDDAPTPWTRAVVAAGGLGALLIAASGVWALAGIVAGPGRPDDGLVVIGSLLGLGLTAFYGVAARRFWGRG